MTKGTPRSSAASTEEKFLEQMNRELAGWDDPAARLRQALARDELRLYCQPIASLQSSGAFAMAETLVRLREEEALLLPPGDFLPAFEHYGMLGELDRWVVRHALQWLAHPPAGGFRCLSVNVSGQTLEDAAFAGFVAGELRAQRVAPSALVLEIDEGDTLSRAQSAARLAHAVKEAGCRVLIDGFGQRSVSFVALKTLRADFVKVDGSIVRALLRSEVARQKLKAIVRVGAALGVEVIAECVEELEILVQLRTLGVGYAQGFGIGRPAPMGGSAPPPVP